ncbi:MAG: CdaR family protein [Fibrobacterales bacterium]
MKNLTLKFAAFFCAILLWFYVMSERQYTYTAELPVITQNIPRTMALMNQFPKTIKAEIKGKGKDLILNKEAPGHFLFDLAHLKLGKNTIDPHKRHFMKPPTGGDVTLITIFNDESIVISAETRISKRIPVRNRVTIEPAPNFILSKEPLISPKHITISGARSLVTKLFEIPTIPLTLSALNHDTTMHVALSPLPSLIEQKENQTEIAIAIEPLRIKPFSDIAVSLLNTPKDSLTYRLEPNSASITITGAKSILETLTPDDITLFIEYNRFNIENKKKLNPTVSIQGEIQSFDLDPKEFELHIDSITIQDTLI